MKYTTLLALYGVIDGAEAMRMQAQEETCGPEVEACTTKLEEIMRYRFYAFNQKWVKDKYVAWWNTNNPADTTPAALSQVQEDFSCTMQLQNCERTTNDLGHYTTALQDAVVAKQWKNMKGVLNYAPNARYTAWMEGRRVKWQEQNPVEPDDGNLTRIAAETAAKKAIPNNGDDVLKVDEDLEFTTAQPTGNECDRTITRFESQNNKRIKTEGKLFSDASFATDQSSLDGKNNKDWASPISFDTYFPSLYGKEGVRPDAVNQGGLGDCWFLAAISAIGEWPERVHKIFNNREQYPGDGKFVVNMFHRGMPLRMTLDDKLPGKSRGAGKFSTSFARKASSGAWWAPILEKAGAKYYGKYQDMSGGWMSEALYAFTGMPCTSLRNKNSSEEKIWATLSDWEERNYIMTCAVVGSGDKKGMVSGHAFTVLGVAEYEGEKLVKCRNPWGSEKYHGPWSDKDTAKWTDAARKALDHENKNDGTFYVPLADFKTIVHSVSTAMYADWIRDDMPTEWDRSTNYKDLSFSFNNPVDQRAVVVISGTQSRTFKKNSCTTEQKSDGLRFRVKDLATGQWMRNSDNWIKKATLGNGDGHGSILFENLKAGDYQIYFDWVWKRSKQTTGKMPFTLSTLTETQEALWNRAE